MDWVPVVFVTFKVVALATAMFFAIKWHYEKGEKGERSALLRAGVTIAGVFVIALVAVSLLAVVLSRTLGLDLGFS